MRSPQNRLKYWTGTVHFADDAGIPACGLVRTRGSWWHSTLTDVTCKRCIAMFGADEPLGLSDPEPERDPNIVRREAERAARRAARAV